MIEALKSDEIVNKVGGRFKLTALIQKRRMEIMDGARPLVEVKHGMTDLEIVIQEILELEADLGVTGPDGQPYRHAVIANVFVDEKDIGWQLVGDGNAWVWEGKNNDPEIANLQDWARRHRKGLWALPQAEREPPWEFMDRIMQQRMRERGQ